jgi:hypothetical protein
MNPQSQVYQPSWEQYKYWFMHRNIALLSTLIVAVLVLNYRHVGVIVAVVVVLTPIVLFSIRYRLLHTRTKLTVEPGRIVFSKRGSDDLIMNIGDTMSGFLGMVGTIPVVSLYIIDSSAQHKIRINAGTWKQEDLQAIATACKLDVFPPEQVVTPKYIKDNYPKVITKQ